MQADFLQEKSAMVSRRFESGLVLHHLFVYLFYFRICCPLPFVHFVIMSYLSYFFISNRAHMKEKFLADLRKARETFKGQELSAVLQNMKKRLDDPNIISPDVVYSMLLSYRDIQDYDAIVQLIDDLEQVPNLSRFITIFYSLV